MITNFRVVDRDQCPTHSTLQLQINPKDAAYWQYAARPVKSLSLLVDKSFTEWHGEAPAPHSEDDILHFTDETDFSMLAPEMREDDYCLKPQPFLKDLASTAAKNLRAVYACAKKRHVVNIQSYMDAAFDIAEPILRCAIEHGDLDHFWELWWTLFEDSLISYTQGNEFQERCAFSGRGHYPVAMQKVTPPKANLDGGDTQLIQPAWLMQLSNHVNRCRHLLSCLNIKAKNKGNDMQLAAIGMDIQDNTDIIIKFLK